MLKLRKQSSVINLDQHIWKYFNAFTLEQTSESELELILITFANILYYD